MRENWITITAGEDLGVFFFSRHSMHTHRYTQHGHWLDLTGQNITQTLKYGLQHTAANRNNMSLDFEVSVPVKNVKIRRF